MAKRRGNHEGSIYQKKNGKWQAQVSIEGKRIGKTFNSRQQCRDWIIKISEQKKRGLTYQGTKVAFREYLYQWLCDAKPRLRPTTFSQYRGLVNNHIIGLLGNLMLSEITPRHIQNAYSEKLNQGTGSRTVEIMHSVIHQSLKQAVRQGLLGSNPAKDVLKPKHEPERMQILSETQIRTLLIASQQVGLRPLIQLAVTTGLRKGEILGVKWSDIDWAGETIRIERQLLRIPGKGLKLVRPKTKTGIRTIKVGPDTLTLMHKKNTDHHRIPGIRKILFFAQILVLQKGHEI